MERDSLQNTLRVTVLLGVSCSLLIASAAVGLRDRQERNKQAAFRLSILEAAHLVPEDGDLDAVFARIEPRLVDLRDGSLASDDAVGTAPGDFDQRAAIRDPALSDRLPRGDDPAGLGRRERFAVVYLVRDEAGGRIDQVVLPVRGKGLFSTLWGFLAVDRDGRTVRGITFYEHGETPGLGAEVDDPDWQDSWTGKQLYDQDGDVTLGLVKGEASGPTEIDGLSGATLTSNGVSAMIEFWMGEDGFGPFLRQLEHQPEALLADG